MESLKALEDSKNKTLLKALTRTCLRSIEGIRSEFFLGSMHVGIGTIGAIRQRVKECLLLTSFALVDEMTNSRDYGTLRQN